ncbi:MAG: hypothetical protein JNL79_06265 [Myxococcales bacterium]|nr:hypothetical protein [Myxococcales bacterium]
MAQEQPRVRLGELLVAAGVLTDAQLGEALALQKAEGSKRRLGRLLVEQKFVEETLLTQVLGRQLSVPWVSLYHVDFSRQLLNLVPREVAEGYGLIPVYVRHVRGQGETLYVATDDPTNDEGLKRVSGFAGLPVRAMIASASDIRAAIRAYYGGGTASVPKQPTAPAVQVAKEEPADEPPPTRVSVPHAKAAAPPPAPTAVAAPPEAKLEVVAEPTPVAPTAPVATAPVAPAAPAPPVDDSPEIEARSITLPPRRGKGKAIALTFLDGTQISLPAPRTRRGAERPEPKAEEPEEGAEHELTARDLVSALRAVSHGADASEILGENPRWEAMFAALLSLLLRKHLIADWEFVEEFRKY